MTLRFTVPGLPIAQPRQRHAVIAGHVRNYTPTDAPVNSFKAAARLLAKAAHRGELITGPVRLTVDFVFPVPKKLKSNYVTKRPDADNLAKGVMDALNLVIWKDDSQVAELIVRKMYGFAQTNVTIEELPLCNPPLQ